MNSYLSPPPTLPAGSSVWGYLRTAYSDTSIAFQRTAIKTYCIFYSLNLTQAFADEGCSGLYIKNRPGLAAMLIQLANPSRLPPGILIFDLTRLSREPMLITFHLREFTEVGILLHSLNAPLCPEFLCLFSAVTQGLQEEACLSKPRRCFLVWQDIPRQPYGFRKVEVVEVRAGPPEVARRVIPDQQEAIIIQMLFEKYAQGMKIEEITEVVNNRDVPPKGNSSDAN